MKTLRTSLLYRTLLALVLVTGMSGCATNAVTGRTQLALVSDEEMIKESENYYAEVLSEYEGQGSLSEDEELIERVTNITNRIIDQAVRYRPESAKWKWDLTVIDDPETLNAWCMAGGKMAIYTGLIDQLELNDDEIAMIMGHEISHAMAGHTAERMSVDLASTAAVTILAYLLGDDAAEVETIQALGGMAVLGLIGLPHSRGNESEADRLGIEFATQAGFNPNAAASVWKKMEAASSGDSGFEFLSTHPSHQRRQQELTEWAAQLRQNPQVAANLKTANQRTPNPWIRKDHNQEVAFNPSKYITRMPPLTLVTRTDGSTPARTSSIPDAKELERAPKPKQKRSVKASKRDDVGVEEAQTQKRKRPSRRRDSETESEE